MNMNELREFVESNPSLVTRKESTTYPGLFVLKYSRKVFFDSLWNEHLEECRGLVVDKDWNVIVHPFTKIYNMGERNTTLHRDDYVSAVRKVNGFMAAVTIHNGDPIVSTTGSLDSDFVGYAKEMLGDIVDRIRNYEVSQQRSSILNSMGLNQRFTWIFEICHPADPHIVPEHHGAYLIGMRDLTGIVKSGPMLPESNLDAWAKVISAKRPEWTTGIFQEFVNSVKSVEHEGFVIRRLDDDKTLKIKSPYYLTLKAMARKKDIMSLDKTRVDEEYYPLLEHLKTIERGFNEMEEQDRLDYIRGWLSAQ